MQSTIGIPPGPGTTVSSSITFTAAPTNCPVAPPPVEPPPSPAAPNPDFQDMLEPQLSITVTKTYIVGAYAWAVASTATPNSLQVYAGSSATARYVVTASRSLSSTPTPRYMVEGVITVTNPNKQSIPIQSVSAAFPWNVVAAAACSVSLPGILNPGASTTCSYRMSYDLGPKPASVSAQAYLAGRAAPVQSATAAQFNFNSADTVWSSGTCAGVMMAYMADDDMLLSMLSGGRAPAFAGTGQPATKVCDSTTFDFTVQFSPDAKFTPGTSKVRCRTALHGAHAACLGWQ